MGIALGMMAIGSAVAAGGALAAPSAQDTSGAAGPIAARLDADPVGLTVGDPVTLTLTVRHPADVRVVPPRLGAMWGDFEIRAQPASTTAVLGDGSRETVQRIAATVFKVGRIQTPPLDLIAVDAAGEAVHVTAPPTPVEVRSVIQADDEMPRDIKAQAELPPAPAWPLIAAGAAAAVIVAVAAAWAWRRRAPASAAVDAGPVDPRSPAEIARDTLADIARAGWLDRGEVKRHYTLVADCVRGYIEAAARVPALEATTAELRPALGGAGLGPVAAAVTLRLLEDADLVKFARWRPPADAAGRLVDEAVAVVGAIERDLAMHGAAASDARGPVDNATASDTGSPVDNAAAGETGDTVDNAAPAGTGVGAPAEQPTEAEVLMPGSADAAGTSPEGGPGA